MNEEAKAKQQKAPSETSFEAAFARLEKILEKMNSGAVSLDESLKLFEEADRLISMCHQRLTEAERKVETLIKNRNGALALDNNRQPITKEFPFPSPPESSRP